jgi:hypothetical protein
MLGIAQLDLAVVPMDRKQPLGENARNPPEKCLKKRIR